jgi:hypothetical protein
MRASASSLNGVPGQANARALAIDDSDEIAWVTHDQIMQAKPEMDRSTPFGRSEIGKALVRLVRKEEVIIS